MNMSKPTYTMSMTEDELLEAIEYYMLNKYKNSIKIKNLTHKTKTWTEGGGGMMEMDYSKPNGIEFTCEGEDL